jgi:hypothetical protein
VLPRYCVSLFCLLAVAGCSELEESAKVVAPAPPPVNRNPPWEVVRTLKPGFAKMLTENATFCLAHNSASYLAHSGKGYLCVDLDKGRPLTDFSSRANLGGKLTTYGLIVGEGDWSLLWTNKDAAETRRYFVSTLDKETKPIELPNVMGLSLATFTMPDGSFVSIRTVDSPRLMLSVYEFKDGKEARIPAGSKGNPYAIWAETALPSIAGWTATYNNQKEIPDQAPTRFSSDGRALAIVDPTDVWEWKTGDIEWERVVLPDGGAIHDAFYAGSLLFAESEGGLLYFRSFGGEWVTPGKWRVLARDGGRNLMVFDGRNVQIVKPD